MGVCQYYASVISIHAPNKGSDNLAKCFTIFLHLFQSTPPTKGATHIHDRKLDALEISIHAPNKGSDFHLLSGQKRHQNFNPRPQQRERPNGYEIIKK